MVFAYFQSLSASNKQIYRQSDKIEQVPLATLEFLQPMAKELQGALLLEDKPQVERIAGELLNGMVNVLDVPEIKVRVLACRPTSGLEELHGLYEPGEGRKKARISVWMRTARHKKIVAYRSFLRTLLHELCHHLDYELFELAESFHTEGFFKRESQLFKLLVPADKKQGIID